MICSSCGKPFELITTRGRPRTRCYECKPTRAKGVTVKPAQPQTVQQLKQSPHCPHCGAFTASADFPFCNPAHRAAFADRVRREQERKGARLTGGFGAGVRGGTKDELYKKSNLRKTTQPVGMAGVIA